MPCKSDSFPLGVHVRHFMEPPIETEYNTGKLVPGLVESWEMAPDGSTWTFKFKEGIPFHGTWGEFKALDALYALAELNKDECIGQFDRRILGAAFGAGKDAVIQATQVTDDHTLVFNMQQPDVIFELSPGSGLSSGWYIYPKAQLDTEGEAGLEKQAAGTGPWKFVQRKVGQFVEYERVDNHHRKTPEFQKLRINMVAEPATRLATLLAGEVHMSSINKSLYNQAEGAGMKVVSGVIPPFASFFAIGQVLDPRDAAYDPNAPLQNVKVREAINRAVNRKEVNDSLFGGRGVLVEVLTHPPHREGWRQRWRDEFDQRYGYDPEKAKSLLAEAGYPNGFKIKVTLGAHSLLPEMTTMGEVMALYLTRIGLDVELIQMPEFGKIIAGWRDRELLDAIIAAPTSFQRPPQFSLALTRPGKGNITTFSDQRIDVRFDKGIASIDFAERDILFGEIGDILFDEYAFVPMMALPLEIVINPKVVAEYKWPTNAYTHLEYLKAAR